MNDPTDTITLAEHGLPWTDVHALSDADLSTDWLLAEIEGRHLALVRRSAWAADPERLRNKLLAARPN